MDNNIRTKKTFPDKKNINIEARTEPGRTYFIDTNGVLKGQWGGFHNKTQTGKNGQKLYEIYYSMYSCSVIIDEFGFFYEKFDCRRYDGVCPFGPNVIRGFNKYDGLGVLYYCEKNGRYGIIDENERIILHITYRDVKAYPLKDLICIVTTETGKFLYNFITKKHSAEYDDIILDYSYQNLNYYRINVKCNDKYGLIDINGNIVLDTKYEWDKYGKKLLYNFNGYRGKIDVYNNMFYGKIPLSEFDGCYKIGHNIFEEYYITEREGYFGLLDWKAEKVADPIFDDIILYTPRNSIFNGLHRTFFTDIDSGISVDIIFVIAKKDNKFWLFNTQDKQCLLENCDKIQYVYPYSIKGDPFIVFYIDGQQGIVTSGGFVLSPKEYDKIHITGRFIIVQKNGKYGVLRITGFEITPCIFDDIEETDEDVFEVSQNGKKKIIDLSIPFSFEDFNTFEPQHRSKYAGSYAQDEMGYSDEDIDTIFDGDPDAYWNID